MNYVFFSRKNRTPKYEEFIFKENLALCLLVVKNEPINPKDNNFL